MSWFLYSDPKKRSHKKGIWLRHRFLPEPILKKARVIMRKGEMIEWVSVCELRPNDKVLLEFWVRSPGDYPKTRDPALKHVARYSVFHLLVDEDPSWVCEGNLGRGLVGG